MFLWPAVLCLKDNPRTVDLCSGFGFLLYGRVQQYFACLLYTSEAELPLYARTGTSCPALAGSRLRDGL